MDLLEKNINFLQSKGYNYSLSRVVNKNQALRYTNCLIHKIITGAIK